MQQISSRIFNQAVSEAKRAALKGPVLITDRGQPAHVLLSFSDYQDLLRKELPLLEALAMPEVAEIEFEPPKLRGMGYSPADLS